MARNTRLWQSHLATPYVYEGDAAECAKWRGWAEAKLKHMLKSSGALSCTFTPMDGIQIRIDTRPNRVHVKTGSTMYLESGFLHLGMTAMCNEATFLPATLEFNSPISAYLSAQAEPLELKASGNGGAGEDSPFRGTPVESGYSSQTCGAKTLQKTAYDLCGNTYTSESESYGDSATMWQCKYAQRYVQSSLYSGKLRLYIQAIYGSTRKDYYATPITINNNVCCDLVVGDYRFIQNIPTTGLLTTDNYEYYIMEVGVSSVVFRKLKLSATAKGWAAILKTHPQKADRAFSSRVEAYILAYSKVSQEESITKTFDTISGVPMAYGWHFNWKGNQAKCVFHTSNGDGTYNAKTYTLDITDDLEVTLTSTAAKPWSNGAYFQFWYPDQYDNAMKTFGVVNGGYVNSTGTPMYGYYDYNDNWKEFSVTCSLAGGYTPTPDTGPLTQSHLTGFGGDSINYSRTYITSGAIINGSVGYAFDGQSFSGQITGTITTQDEFTNPVVDTSSYTGGGVFESVSSDGVELRDGYTFPWIAAQWPAANNDAGWRNNYAGRKWIVDTLNGVIPPNGDTVEVPINVGLGDSSSISLDFNRYSGLNRISEISFGITFGDCEAVVYGYYSGRTWTQRATGTGALTAVLFRVVQGFEVYRWQTGTGWVTTGVKRYMDAKQRLRVSGNSPSISGLTNLGAGGDLTTTISYSSGNSLGWTNESVSSQVIKTSQDSEMPTWAEKYFRVGDGFGGVYNPTMIAKASANGAHILYHGEENSPIEGGYPDGVYSAVGWA